MSEDKLTRDDLVLLMESYRNMITMHQTILDQTSKTINTLNDIANKQDSLFSKQGQVCNSLQNITSSLTTVTTNLSIATDKIDNMNVKIIDKLQVHEKKSIEEHGKLLNKIHIGWIGMGSIILGLVGLIYTITNLIPTM